jgi:hypothetical protein
MKYVSGLVASLSCLVFAAQAHAADPLQVKTDQTQLLSVSADPGAVVVGNPSIADVTVHGRQIFLHGRAFGETNLIILDPDGNQIANFDVTVTQNTANAMSVFKGGQGGVQRYSHVCAPGAPCEVALQVGDPPQLFSQYVGSWQSKLSMATGKSSADSATPPIAQ